jgi:hypothetical protein
LADESRFNRSVVLFLLIIAFIVSLRDIATNKDKKIDQYEPKNHLRDKKGPSGSNIRYYDLFEK